MRAMSVVFLLLMGCVAPEAPRQDAMDPVGAAAPEPEWEPNTIGAVGLAQGQAAELPPDRSPSEYELCFEEIAAPPDVPAPDYDQFGPTIGSHCSGTDHQDIQGIERVVFLGDSVTVGTPPTMPGTWYRNQLADRIADQFGLEKPGWFWENVDVFEGTSWVQEGGDFASCAKWGARTDDLMAANSQVLDCFPEALRDQTTLVVITVGGNDLQNLQEGFQDGTPNADLWLQIEDTMALYREAIEWITSPGRFPNGVYVIATNLYEYTDASGDVTSCPGAALAGYEAIEDPALTEMVVWAMEEFMSVAVDTQTDMMFLLEHFCGHGYQRDDPNGRCYRGPDAELWFDLTCIHPNATGHTAMAEMFTDIIVE